MHPRWFGDSYDIVKRFFVEILRDLGYAVYIDLMATSEWSEADDGFFEFLGVEDIRTVHAAGKSALLVDPDKGIGREASAHHTTIAAIVQQLQYHEVVFAYDQSFSRGKDLSIQLQRKLMDVRILGAHGFYYNSHACFLFCTLSTKASKIVQAAIVDTGVPEGRLVTLGALEK